MRLALQMYWMTVFSASVVLELLWASHMSEPLVVYGFAAALISARAAARPKAEEASRAAAQLILCLPLALPYSIELTSKCICMLGTRWEPYREQTQRASHIVMAAGPVMLVLMCCASVWRRLHRMITHLRKGGALPPVFLAPEPPADFPRAIALTPAIARRIGSAESRGQRRAMR